MMPLVLLLALGFPAQPTPPRLDSDLTPAPRIAAESDTDTPVVFCGDPWDCADPPTDPLVLGWLGRIQGADLSCPLQYRGHTIWLFGYNGYQAGRLVARSCGREQTYDIHFYPRASFPDRDSEFEAVPRWDDLRVDKWMAAIRSQLGDACAATYVSHQVTDKGNNGYAGGTLVAETCHGRQVYYIAYYPHDFFPDRAAEFEATPIPDPPSR